jgi:hypothetical protein
MKIESYEFGQIVVGGESYSSDLIIYPDRVEAGWWRRSGHELHPDDLSGVLENAPEVLVVGTGKWGRMRVLEETEALLRRQNIQIMALKTDAACRTFNQLCQTGTRAVAALHLTC